MKGGVLTSRNVVKFLLRGREVCYNFKLLSFNNNELTTINVLLVKVKYIIHCANNVIKCYSSESRTSCRTSGSASHPLAACSLLLPPEPSSSALPNCT